MRKLWINIILFLLFITEGTVFQFITPDYYGSDITIVPRFVLAAIVYLSIFRNQQYALWLGIVFGMLYDVVYGDVFGVYTIAMGTVGYFSGWLTLFFHPTLTFFTLSFVFFEFFIFSVQNLYQLVTIPANFSIIYVIIPSILFNLIFAFLIYIPLQFKIEGRD